MSGTQVSSFGNAAQNALFDPLMARRQTEYDIANQYAPARNQLLLEQGQQQLGANEIEYMARAAQGVLGLPAEQRPAAYSSAVADLQRYGFARNAPAQYPGDAAIQRVAAMGTSSEKQAEFAANLAANRALLGGGTAPPAAGTGTGTAGGSTGPVALGMRQNNPGNLMFAGQPGATPGQGNRFATFPDMPTGVAATADQLARNQTQHGLNTVRGQVTRWVSDPKADLTSYIADISKALGVGPDTPIDFTDPKVQAAFILAQQPHESAGGGAVLNPADVEKGVQMAAAQRGQIVQARPASTQTATAAPQGGVAARTGGTDVAGPGAGTGAPAATTAPLLAAPAPATAPAAVSPAPPQPTAAPEPAPEPTAAPRPASAPIPPPAQLQLDAQGLTAQDRAVLQTLGTVPGMKPVTLATTMAEMAQRNQATNEKALADWRAAETQRRQDAQFGETQRQHDIENQRAQAAAARAEEQLKIAQAEATRKAKQAAQPYQGTDISAQDTNVLMTAQPSSKEYAIAYERMAQPIRTQDGSLIYPNLSAFEKPTYKPPGGAETPDYSTPKVTAPTIMTQDQARAGTYADRMQNSNAVISQLDAAATNWWQRRLSHVGGAIDFGLNSSDFQKVKQAQENFVNAALRLESGAVISKDEFDRAAKQYFPQPGDSAEVIAQKKANREAEIAGFVREAGPAYKPPKQADPLEGRTATGPNGQKLFRRNGKWEPLP